jgi:type IV pilus assembly protein PilE
MKKNPSQFGFHLFELLITLSIISILATISFPIYSHYFVKEKRYEALNQLHKLAIALEKYHIENDTYENATLMKLKFREKIVNGNYLLQLQSLKTNFYRIAVKPIGQQARNDKQCGTLILNAIEEKKITGPGKITECWM